MAVRRPTRPAGKVSARKKEPDSLSRRASALLGGLLICIVILWCIWLFTHQIKPGLVTIQFPFAGQSQPTAQPTVDPLLAAGITLSTPGQNQNAQLSQSQALLLANQIESQAAAHAGNVSAQYVLLTYEGKNTAAVLHNAPTWLIHYSKVTGTAPDNGADPRARATTHDCYLFLDANSGQELFAIWV